MLNNKRFITKRMYQECLICPKNAWLNLYKKDLSHLFEPTEHDAFLMKQGIEVGCLARELFPKGSFVEGHDDAAVKFTQYCMEHKVQALFEPAFIFDNYIVRNDILAFNQEDESWNLYEVKAKTKVERKKIEIDDIEDVSYQHVVLKDNNVNIRDIYLIYLNKEYARNGDIDINELFIIENVTEEVKRRESKTRIRMQQAKTTLNEVSEDALSCDCIFKIRSSHCQTTSYSHKYVPAYGIHDIARISEKKLKVLLDNQILELPDISDDFELTDIQRNQVLVCKAKQPLINTKFISDQLNSLRYPLYFLDYETYATAIPTHKGFRPYEQVPCQFSLHKVYERFDKSPMHFEFLHDSNTDPSLLIVDELKKIIGPEGSIIVWNKTFEQIVHKKLAKRHPEHESFLLNLNERMFDLLEIFQKQAYVHSGFQGKTSLKNVLSVIDPQLSYKNLDVQDGSAASLLCFNVMSNKLSSHEKEVVMKNLKEYCFMDTFGMYRIWQFLGDLV